MGFISVGCWVLGLMSCSVQAEQVRVAVAANFLSTLNIIQPGYEALSGDRLLISAASTGKLFAQIHNGAPFDVLLAADQHYPQKLEADGLIVAGSRFVYAQGQLVLWARNVEQGIGQANFLQSSGRIAVANPRTAPYGMAAQQVLRHLVLPDTIDSRLVRGESVGQAFQFVATGNAEYGFVALSQVLSPFYRFNRDNYWLIPHSMYEPLYQDAALLIYGQAKPAAQAFLDYLKTPQVRELIRANGYL